MDQMEHDWIVQKWYDETCLQLRNAWDIYIKFYTVFLTVNILGLGLVVQHIDSPGKRWPIVVAFLEACGVRP